MPKTNTVKPAKTARPEPAKRRPLRRLLYWAACAGVWLVILAGVTFAALVHDLPRLDRLPPPARDQALVVKGARGQTLASYGAIYGDWLTYQEIPEILVLALLAVEDRRFFDHGGVDPRGVARAAVANLKAGAVREGGSTITQQLAKNLFLSPEQTLRRKLQEMLVAVWLERLFTKPELLELYLNRVYFGAGTYGVDAAARSYFGHSARRLSLAEAALLAGILKAPSSLAPTRNPEGAYERASTVLAAMVDAGVLTDAAAARARAVPAALSPDWLGGDVRYFTDWVVRNVRALVAERDEPLIVYTTLDSGMQAAAERALSQGLRREGVDRQVSQGAIVAMSPDGAVKAMVGGADYGQSQFNRAVQAKRQTGSAFKPLVFLAALEHGLAPGTQLDDAPITVDGWQPQNFSRAYRGPVTMAEALRDSLNTPAVRLQERIGRDTAVTVAKKLGIASPLAPHRSLVLGSEEVSLVELTGAYAGIANSGLAVAPYAVLEIHSLSGELLYRRTPAPDDRAVSRASAGALTTMLQAVVAEGTGKVARIDRPAAGKTGTSQDYRDALFVGFTADLVAGVWVGNDDNAPMKGVTGGGLPARIWSGFMIDAHAGIPPKPLARTSLAEPMR
ncbi:MAG: transglycosylase domain-containing protein [Rhodothalassiaceae bacterium]